MARLTQFEIPFIYFKTGGSPRKFYGGDGFSSMFLKEMDFSFSMIMSSFMASARVAAKIFCIVPDLQIQGTCCWVRVVVWCQVQYLMKSASYVVNLVINFESHNECPTSVGMDGRKEH